MNIQGKTASAHCVNRYQPRDRLSVLLIMLCIAGLLSACGINQNYSSAQHNAIDLSADDLHNQGVAFISPSTITGQEEDKQVLAFVFANTLARERPDIKVTTLPETLGAINKAGLATEYNRMFQDYRETGIFNRASLNRVGKATRARYLIQLNLANFRQESRGRFSMLGFRVYQTSHANIRLFIQIWDSTNGSIVWEGVEELNLAQETSKEKTITFTSVVEASAQNLIALLPKQGDVKPLAGRPVLGKQIELSKQ
ncbi:hypothetical protein [Marinobacterium rhizophilum]|uniref:hypothetical protein n=1 Tax=Marinobacterium rhizophilum TaxID=420402 RepID=UPI000367A88E|nr:hypothetical protein [Marinobacterium rhizophilum]